MYAAIVNTDYLYPQLQTHRAIAVVPNTKNKLITLLQYLLLFWPVQSLCRDLPWQSGCFAEMQLLQEGYVRERVYKSLSAPIY